MAESIEFEEQSEIERILNLGMTDSLKKMMEEQTRKDREREERIQNIKNEMQKSNRLYSQLIKSLLTQIDRKAEAMS